MNGNPDHADSIVSRSDCQRIVRALIKKFEWALLSEDDLVELVLDSREMISPNNLERQIKHEYTIALYEACWQTEDLSRRERGYQELFRILFRVAYNRWPELAEDATQRALLLVYQQIERCRDPAAFLGFALYKLRQGFKEEQRTRDKTAVPKSLNIVTDQQGTQVGNDSLPILIEAIENLPNERQQKAILLKFFGGLSDRDIAARLEVSVANVRKLRHDGLVRLRQDKQLQDYFNNVTFGV